LFKIIPVKKQGKYNLNVQLQDLGDKISIIVFLRVWVQIIFTNNFSNPGFLSKRQSQIQRDKKRCAFQENQFSY